ncbi:MAG: hypothetical protein FWG34_01985 [Oscillospiraceae bacterium]|nr:hypothetical protein [Oscillospiraceae bacterium]
MTDGMKKALDYIGENSAYVKTAIKSQTAVWRGEKTEIPALALSCPQTEEQRDWIAPYNLKEIHFDSEKMFANGLREVLCAVNGNYGSVPSMRANMGCGIISSLFGTQQRLFEDIMPWLVDHAKKEDIETMGENHEFEIGDSAEFAAAMGHMEFMTKKLRESGLAEKVFVYPLDLQGPIDTAHLVYGDSIFYDFYDDPEFVHHLLKLGDKAVYFAMGECFARMDKSGELIAHYNHLILPKGIGGVKISEDTTTLLSPQLIDEFAKPRLGDMLKHFGGGYVHYCGKNDYLLESLFGFSDVFGINFGNPEMHDMAKVQKRCREAKKAYVGAINKKEGESLFDYFTRVLSPSYDADTGCFFVILQYSCNLGERGNVIGEFERAAEYIVKTGGGIL